MRKQILRAALSLALVSTIGCGSKSSGDKNDNNNQKAGNGLEFNVIDGDVQNKNGKLVGSGKIVFVDSLGAVKANKNFQLDFSLDDGSSLVVHTFSDNKLQGGVDVEFKRSGDTVTTKVKNTKFLDANVDSDGQVSAMVEVHNLEGKNAHVIVEANSEDHGSTDGDWGNGGGTFWGLTLKDASVSEPKVGDAQHGH